MKSETFQHQNTIPEALEVELTWACNEKCVHCYLKHAKPPITMSASVLSRLKQAIMDNSIKEVLLTGGEVFLHHGLLDLVGFLTEAKVQVKVFSNLNECNESQLSRLAGCGIQLVQTSVYSVNDRIHDRVTGVNGSLAKTLESLFFLQKLGVTVEVACPLTTMNYRDLFEVLKFFSARSIKAYADFFISSELGEHASNLRYRLSEPHIRELHDICMRECPEYLYLWNEQKGMKEINIRDMAIFSPRTVCVRPDGSVAPMIGMDYILGSIATDSLAEIMQSHDAVRLASIRMDDFEECRLCEAVTHCPACFAGHYSENGNRLDILNGKLCGYVRLMRELYLMAPCVQS